MSNLVDFAKRELDLIGMTAESTDEMNIAMREHILKMVEMFADEGHSGSSAAYAIGILQKVLDYKPLSPLTGADDEWNSIDESMGGSDMAFQNKRCPHVFMRSDGSAYDAQGRVFWETYTDPETGKEHKSYFTGRGSRVDITFPYIPNVEYVERKEE
jgi:hypothetical protein